MTVVMMYMERGFVESCTDVCWRVCLHLGVCDTGLVSLFDFWL